MAGFVNDSGAREHNDRLMQMIRGAAQAAIDTTGPRLLESAAARAPSIDEEYSELNAEAGRSPMVDRAGSSSADSDGRVRFAKSEETYLEPGILSPVNMQFASFQDIRSVRVGNRPFLTSITFFSYSNKGKNAGTYRVGPYFDMFEGGTAGAAVSDEGITTFTVVPHESRADGGSYPLRPGNEVEKSSEGTRSMMVKSIVRRGMFDPIALDMAAKAVISPALAELGPALEA